MATQNNTHQPQHIKFTNHLMFNAVLTENEDLCIRLIETILGLKVEQVRYLDDEHVLQPSVDGRGARLDLLALVDGKYVDIEMQVGREPHIGRRCRFYHSAIATRFTPKGAGYESVPRSYVIFICLDDPLGAGLSRYELATSCRNSASVQIDDGAKSILLNASAWRQEQNAELAGMLEYALTGRSEGALAKDIAKAVNAKNLDQKWVRQSMGIMTYEHEFTVLNAELERKRQEVADIQAKAEATQAELEAAQAEVDAVQIELEAAQSKLEAAQAEARAIRAKVEVARADVEAAQAQAQEAQAQVQEARAQADAAQALQDLSKRLYADGRIDEYFTALEDPQLMLALKKEYGQLQ